MRTCAEVVLGSPEENCALVRETTRRVFGNDSPFWETPLNFTRVFNRNAQLQDNGRARERETVRSGISIFDVALRFPGQTDGPNVGI
ncbi:hypothetical protein F2P79_023987 [Pimephales promelas]|nr:hypothetical protein F2P79_023987 [Pimephales promelas]